MKITVNFAHPPLSWVPPAAALWALALLMGVMAGLMLHAAGRSREDEPRLHARIAHTKKKADERSTIVLPSPSQREELRRRIEEWNRIAGVKGWSTAQLLAWLEQHTPQEVHFVSFHHEPRDGDVTVVAQSASAAALTRFLRTLESESNFAEVLLSKQADRPGPAAVSQFEITLKLKP